MGGPPSCRRTQARRSDPDCCTKSYVTVNSRSRISRNCCSHDQSPTLATVESIRMARHGGPASALAPKGNLRSVADHTPWKEAHFPLPPTPKNLNPSPPITSPNFNFSPPPPPLLDPSPRNPPIPFPKAPPASRRKQKY